MSPILALAFVALVLAAIALVAWLALGTMAARDTFVAAYPFPPQLRRAVARRYPHLAEPQLDLVVEQLRGYFQLCRQTRALLAMPSQAVDVAWHEFILATRQYQRFCERGFGRFLHHTPAEAMTGPAQASTALRRCWQLACRRAGIDARRPRELPPLFALDARLAIPDGFHYVPDCRLVDASRNGQVVHCGGDLGGGDGGSSDGGDSGGDGGGGSCGGGGD